MIIKCPSCHSEFSMDGRLLGIRGKKVRCSVCQFSWFQKSKAASKVTEVKFPPLPKNLTQPEIYFSESLIKKKEVGKKRYFLKVFTLTSFLVLSVGFLFFKEDLEKSWYFFKKPNLSLKRGGKHLSEVLKQENLEIRRNLTGGSVEEVLDMRIRNTANYPIELSFITIIFYDRLSCLNSSCEVGRVQTAFPSTKETLEIKENSTYDLNYVFKDSIPKGAKYLAVKFGIKEKLENK